jgi:hypothetical protein
MAVKTINGLKSNRCGLFAGVSGNSTGGNIGLISGDSSTNLGCGAKTGKHRDANSMAWEAGLKEKNFNEVW